MTGGLPRAPRRKLFMRTWGCQMNVYDSARMADVLAAIGYVTTDRPDDADMIVLNTCHIRERASEKLFSELGRLRPVKQARVAAGGELVLAVAGCVAQAEGGEILDRAPWVDIVLGPQTYHRLPELVARAARAEDFRISACMTSGIDSKFDHLPAHGQPEGPAAFLTVQEGCDRFCTFCVVPYTRGAEFSRPAAAVLAEAGDLATRGVRDITLLGQNVNAWHGAAPDGGEWRLGRLIRALAGLPGLERIRYTTSHPRDMDDDLIAAHGDVPQCMPWLHLPVQSGADRILQAMNRGHTADDYLRLVDRLRAARPDIAMSSDFIVGFPGETDADFDATMRLVDRVGYASAYSFIYSPRPGTPAAVMADQVPPAVARARLSALQALIGKQQAIFNEATVGRDLPVLFERPGRHPGQIVGRSPWMQAVHVTGAGAAIGQLADIRIDGCTTHGLTGVPVARPMHAATAAAPGAGPEVRA